MMDFNSACKYSSATQKNSQINNDDICLQLCHLILICHDHSSSSGKICTLTRPMTSQSFLLQTVFWCHYPTLPLMAISFNLSNTSGKYWASYTPTTTQSYFANLMAAQSYLANVLTSKLYIAIIMISVGDPNDFFRIRILVFRTIRIRIGLLSAPDPNPHAFGFGFRSE